MSSILEVLFEDLSTLSEFKFRTVFARIQLEMVQSIFFNISHLTLRQLSHLLLQNSVKDDVSSILTVERDIRIFRGVDETNLLNNIGCTSIAVKIFQRRMHDSRTSTAGYFNPPRSVFLNELIHIILIF